MCSPLSTEKRSRSVAVRETARVYRQDLDGIEVLDAQITQLDDYADAVLAGMGVVEYDSSSKAAGEIKDLAREIDALMS